MRKKAVYRTWKGWKLARLSKGFVCDRSAGALKCKASSSVEILSTSFWSQNQRIAETVFFLYPQSCLWSICWSVAPSLLPTFVGPVGTCRGLWAHAGMPSFQTGAVKALLHALLSCCGTNDSANWPVGSYGSHWAKTSHTIYSPSP